MKKFLKNNVLSASINVYKKNCRRASGSSFFTFTLYLRFICLMPLIIPACISAQQPQDYNHLAFQNILSLRFDEASLNIGKSKEINPENPCSVFLENLQDFLRCVIDGDDASYQEYKATNAKRTGMLNSHAGNVALYYKAEMNFHSFLLAMYHQENLYALRKLILAWNQLNHFLKQADNPAEGRKLRGMMLVVFSAIPDEIEWMSSLAGIRSNFDEGITMLEKNLQTHKPGSPEFIESVIIITYLKNIIKQDYQASFNRLGKLPAEYLENPLYRLIYIISASKSRHNDEVIRIAQTYHQDPHEHHVCYFDYLYGSALLNRMDRNAEIALQKYVECTLSDIYLKSAYRKLAWNYLIHSDTSSFERFRKLVLETGSQVADVDRQAYHECALPGIPNTDLLKARLLFDGGYYRQAKSLLLKKATREGLQNAYQQTEYAYRLARIYHQNNETGKAARLYRFTFENGMKHPVYYAACSALQLGNIYEQLGDFRKAKSYYLKVLRTSEKSYGYRFRHSAREGIRRLDDINTAQE
ncbi:MAG: tetratricopeptide repeat-containing protein [Bacteroidales bacterium]|nr:tetratricopeptide repeat-containing protein [Bacteroidales bacterium]